MKPHDFIVNFFSVFYVSVKLSSFFKNEKFRSMMQYEKHATRQTTYFVTCLKCKTGTGLNCYLVYDNAHLSVHIKIWGQGSIARILNILH